MAGWVDGGMDGWMNGRVDGALMNRRVSECMRGGQVAFPARVYGHWLLDGIQEEPTRHRLSGKSVLESSRKRRIRKNNGFSGPRSRWIDKNSILEVSSLATSPNERHSNRDAEPKNCWEPSTRLKAQGLGCSVYTEALERQKQWFQ